MFGCWSRATASASARNRTDLVAAREAADHLERHASIECTVPRLVDDAHPAATEFADDLVTRHRRHDIGPAGHERDATPRAGGGGSSSPVPESHVEDSPSSKDSAAEPHTGHGDSTSLDSQEWPFAQESFSGMTPPGSHGEVTRRGVSNTTTFFVSVSVTVIRSVKVPRPVERQHAESARLVICFTSSGFSLWTPVRIGLGMTGLPAASRTSISISTSISSLAPVEPNGLHPDVKRLAHDAARLGRERRRRRRGRTAPTGERTPPSCRRSDAGTTRFPSQSGP